MRAQARPRRGSGRLRLPLTLVTIGTLLLLSGCASEQLPQNALDPAGPVARSQDDLWDLVFPIAIGVFVLVETALLFFIFRYRDRGDDRIPKQVAGNTKLEIIWTLIPAVILAGVAVPTVQTLFELAEEPTDNPLEVRVIGKQYWWEFEYLNDEGQGVVTSTDLHIPAGRSVYLHMQSLSAILNDPGADEIDVRNGGLVNNGVIHSFWVPRLAGKQDVVPHHTRFMTIEADEPGLYEGQCAEFCGLSHARMRMNVIAQEPAEFQQWLDEQAQPAQEPTDQLAQQGAELFATQQCIACHAIEGYEVDGQVADVRIGPDLTHFASRLEMAGGIIDVNEENIKRWLANPQEVKSGAQMPNLGLDAEQIEALTAYLLSLE